MEPTRGFIALISAIIISTVLLSVAATLGQGSFFARFDGLNGEYRTLAQGMANSCLRIALIKIRDDYDYTVMHDSAYDSVRGGVVIPLGSLYDRDIECILMAPTTAPTETNHQRAFTVQAHAQFNGAQSTQELTATVFKRQYPQGMQPILTTSGWHEVP